MRPITGTGRSRSAAHMRCSPVMNSRAAAASSAAISWMFAPPMKARSPAPVSTTARSSSRAASAVTSPTNSAISAAPRMFSRAALSIVTRATVPASRDWKSTCTRGPVAIRLSLLHLEDRARGGDFIAGDGEAALDEDQTRGALHDAGARFDEVPRVDRSDELYVELDRDARPPLDGLPRDDAHHMIEQRGEHAAVNDPRGIGVLRFRQERITPRPLLLPRPERAEQPEKAVQRARLPAVQGRIARRVLARHPHPFPSSIAATRSASRRISPASSTPREFCSWSASPAATSACVIRLRASNTGTASTETPRM